MVIVALLPDWASGSVNICNINLHGPQCPSYGIYIKYRDFSCAPLQWASLAKSCPNARLLGFPNWGIHRSRHQNLPGRTWWTSTLPWTSTRGSDSGNPAASKNIKRSLMRSSSWCRCQHDVGWDPCCSSLQESPQQAWRKGLLDGRALACCGTRPKSPGGNLWNCLEAPISSLTWSPPTPATCLPVRVRGGTPHRPGSCGGYRWGDSAFVLGTQDETRCRMLSTMSCYCTCLRVKMWTALHLPTFRGGLSLHMVFGVVGHIPPCPPCTICFW